MQHKLVSKLKNEPEAWVKPVLFSTWSCGFAACDGFTDGNDCTAEDSFWMQPILSKQKFKDSHYRVHCRHELSESKSNRSGPLCFRRGEWRTPRRSPPAFSIYQNLLYFTVSQQARPKPQAVSKDGRLRGKESVWLRDIKICDHPNQAQRYISTFKITQSFSFLPFGEINILWLGE